jgi:hypothetical protein
MRGVALSATHGTEETIRAETGLGQHLVASGADVIQDDATDVD